ncbi:NACHT domain-containing protein [Nostoc sp. CALU 546]|uniref:NACHT domain-containing protein n=1 Tax=Nostoc sp. CALU 546 TaxID=1867241 RepID=UPI003B6741AB
MTVSFDETLNIVNELVFAKRCKHLNEPEVTVLKGAWDDWDYDQMAKHSRFSTNYLQRGVASRLFDVLTKTIGNGERITKRNVKFFLEQATKHYYSKLASKEEIYNLSSGQVLGGQPPELSVFYGRTYELMLLKQLVNTNRCVAIVGVAGVGKTMLAAKLISEFTTKKQSPFDCFIWKSLAYAPLLNDLLDELLELVCPEEYSSNPPEYTQAKITLLLKQLQTYRCLIVLDEVEGLFQSNNLSQRLDYRLFFRRLVEEKHKSCLLLTSQILLSELNDLQSSKRPLHFFNLEGLDPDSALQLLRHKGLTDKEDCLLLIENYRGNPSELESLVDKINHYFAGSTQKFLEYKTTFISSKLEATLNHLFSQVLTEIERTIIIYIAQTMILNSQPITFLSILENLKDKNKASFSTSELVKALEKLEMQSLIEGVKDPNTKEISFTLQPVIKKYITTDPLGLVQITDALPILSTIS